MLVKFVIVWKSESAAQPERGQGTLPASSLTSNLKKPLWEIQLQKMLKGFSFIWKNLLSSQLPQPEQLLVLELILGIALAAPGKKDIPHVTLKSGWVPSEHKSQPPPFQTRGAYQTYPWNAWQGTTSPVSLHFWQLYLHFHSSTENRIMEHLQHPGQSATNTDSLQSVASHR